MAVQRIQLKKLRLSEMNEESEGVMIVGVIIAKELPYYCVCKNSSSTSTHESAFWNFVIRDSPYYYANVVCFGNKMLLIELYNKFRVGDVVSIYAPEIKLSQRCKDQEQFCRIILTRYTLVLTEELYRRLGRYQGNQVPYLDLLHFVTKPVSGASTIAEVQCYRRKQEGVDLFGCLKFIGKVQERSTPDGIRPVRELIIVDQTSSALRVYLSDTNIIGRVASWRVSISVLFITNVSCEWSDFYGSMIARLTSRSIVTEDPVAPETSTLKDHILRMNHSALVDSRALYDDDLSSIKTVMTIGEVLKKADDIMAEMKTAIIEHEFTAVVTALISDLDFSGLSRLITLECTRCNTILGKPSSIVQNNRCVGYDYDHSNIIVTFDIRLALSDTTGILRNCRVFGHGAEEMLNCTVQQYLDMNDEQKARIESKLLQQCRKFYVHVVAVGLRSATVSILNSILTAPSDGFIQK